MIYYLFVYFEYLLLKFVLSPLDMPSKRLDTPRLSDKGRIWIVSPFFFSCLYGYDGISSNVVFAPQRNYFLVYSTRQSFVCDTQPPSVTH